MRASRCTRCSSPSPTTEKRTDLDQSARPDRRPPSVAARQPPPAAQGERSRSAPFTPSGSFPRRRGKRRRPPQSLARQLSPLRRGSEIPSPAERDRARPSGRARVAEGLPSITSPASGGSGAHNPSPAAAGEGGRRPEGGAFRITARIRLDRSAHPLNPSGELPPQAGEAKQKAPSVAARQLPPLRRGSGINPFPREAGSSAALRPGEGGRRPPFNPFPRTGGGRWPEAGRGRFWHHRADAPRPRRLSPSPLRGASPASGGSEDAPSVAARQLPPLRRGSEIRSG